MIETKVLQLGKQKSKRVKKMKPQSTIVKMIKKKKIMRKIAKIKVCFQK